MSSLVLINNAGEVMVKWWREADKRHCQQLWVKAHQDLVHSRTTVGLSREHSIHSLKPTEPVSSSTAFIYVTGVITWVKCRQTVLLSAKCCPKKCQEWRRPIWNALLSHLFTKDLLNHIYIGKLWGKSLFSLYQSPTHHGEFFSKYSFQIQLIVELIIRISINSAKAKENYGARHGDTCL